jgi:hypothetical protein
MNAKRHTSSQACSLPSPLSHPSACLMPVRMTPRGCHYVCVFITAEPIIKLCGGGEGDSEGHVL